VEATTPADSQPVPTEDEVLQLLGEAARGGSVAAMRELRAYHRESGPGALAELDELAHRRARQKGKRG
jgi:hypothetical protein